MNLKHFNIDEFACGCGCGRHVQKMDEDFLERLDAARDRGAVKFKITSGYRCPTYNMSIGGKPNSAHLRGKAADIYVPTSYARYWMIQQLMAEGFQRIGIGADFIHVDSDDSLPYDVIWTYYKKD